MNFIFVELVQQSVLTVNVAMRTYERNMREYLVAKRPQQDTLMSDTNG